MLLPLGIVWCGNEHIDSDDDGSVKTMATTMTNIQMVLVKMKPYNERVLKKRKNIHREQHSRTRRYETIIQRSKCRKKWRGEPLLSH